ncbi:hypothetical protein M2422_004386 [Enterobacter sp. SLBN-59]|nr:hypothetical protein [Enterobacter sp. SLBN-59]
MHNTTFENNSQELVVNKTVHIVIIDDDAFFTEGLCQVLTAYLEFRNWKTEFSFNHNTYKPVDILFESVSHRAGMRYADRGIPYYFALADRQSTYTECLRSRDRYNGRRWRRINAVIPSTTCHCSASLLTGFTLMRCAVVFSVSRGMIFQARRRTSPKVVGSGTLSST